MVPVVRQPLTVLTGMMVKMQGLLRSDHFLFLVVEVVRAEKVVSLLRLAVLLVQMVLMVGLIEVL